MDQQRYVVKFPQRKRLRPTKTKRRGAIHRRIVRRGRASIVKIDRYYVTASYKRSLDVALDKRIEKAAQRRRTGSGYTFIGDGSRDLSFDYQRRDWAVKAAARIRASAHGVRARVYERSK